MLEEPAAPSVGKKRRLHACLPPGVQSLGRATHLAWTLRARGPSSEVDHLRTENLFHGASRSDNQNSTPDQL